MRTIPSEPLAHALWIIERQLGAAIDGPRRELLAAVRVARSHASQALDQYERKQGTADSVKKAKSRGAMQAERDAYLFDAYSGGETLERMLAGVAMHPDWPQLSSRAAALNAAKRWAKKNKKRWPRRKMWTQRSGYAADRGHHR